MIFPGQAPLWLGAVVVLAWGTCAIVAATALCVRPIRSAAWQRTFWRGAILSILALVATEATGIGSGIVQWCRIQCVVPGPAVSLLKETADSSTRMADWAEFAASMDVASPSESVSCALAERLDGDGIVDCIQPPIPSFEVASSRIRENSDVFRGGRSPTQGPNSHEFGYSPSKKATSKTSRGDSHGSSVPVATAPPLPPGADTVGCVLFLVWGLGAMVLLVRMTWARWLLERFRRQQRRMDQPVVRLQVDRLAARLGIGRRVEILTSPRLAAPIAFGYFRLVIALPAGFSEDFDDCQREAMLAHEVAHLASGDSGWQLLADLAAVVLWWHPLVWWMRRRWRAASELAADEACLLVPRGADALAACLVILARRLDSRPRLAWLSMAGPGLRSALGQRVERLLALSACAWRPANSRWIGVVTATVPVAFLVLVISCTVWARTQAPVAERTTTMKVFVDGWRQSLAAVALAAVLGPVSGDGSSAVAAEDERPVPQVRGEREVREREGDRPASARRRSAGGRRGEPIRRVPRLGGRTRARRRPAGGA
jgi:beta-lactamase regulating signal transducer with metallopeptidase domain